MNGRLRLDGWQWREFGNWPLARRALVCALLGGLAFALPWFAPGQSNSATLSALLASEHELRQQLAQAQQHAAQTAASTEHPLLPAPAHPAITPDLPELMAELAQIAHANGLLGVQLRPGREFVRIGPWRGTAIALRLGGNWPQLATFAEHLAAPVHGVPVSLEDVQLRTVPDNPQAPVHSSAQLELQANLHLWQPEPGVSISASGNTPMDEGRPAAYWSMNMPLLRRDPFTPIQTITPALSRSALEQLPLSAFSMLGTLDTGKRRIGLLLAVDGQLHRIIPGDRIGRHRGRVTAINRQRISIIEQIPDGAGGWHERPVSIELNARLDAHQATGQAHEHH